MLDMDRRCQLGCRRHRRGDPCCADCDQPECKDRCLNDPDRCGQVLTCQKMRVYKRSSDKNSQQKYKITVFPGESKDKFIGM